MISYWCFTLPIVDGFLTHDVLLVLCGRPYFSRPHFLVGRLIEKNAACTLKGKSFKNATIIPLGIWTQKTPKFQNSQFLTVVLDFFPIKIFRSIAKYDKFSCKKNIMNKVMYVTYPEVRGRNPYLFRTRTHIRKRERNVDGSILKF